jgi:hypothetical protein
LHQTQTFKPPVSIKKESDPRKEVNKEYNKLAKQFITLHPKCQVKSCNAPSACVHHKSGRVGELLLNTKYFLAVCLPCHRKIEENPTWAKKEGYSVSRISEKL